MSGSYRDATEAAARFDRGWRKFFEATGRQPERMLTGLASGAMPPTRDIEGRSRMPGSLLLTPKGRLVTELRIGRGGEGEAAPMLLDVPEAGVAGAMDHFARYLPPRLARVSPLPDLGLVSVVGPAAPARLAAALASAGVEPGSPAVSPPSPEALERSAEGDEWILGDGTGALRVVRSGEVAPHAFDVIGPSALRRSIARALDEIEVPLLDEPTWHLLRIEKGRPAFGVEVDEDTLPPEAGMDVRLIDHTKGCYTGQEVIVRIRDRGHVNRRLRGLLLGDQPTSPTPGTPLFDDRGNPIGVLRSAVRSPRFGETVGLAFVRRETEPPADVRVGSPNGFPARVRAIEEAGWTLVKGDPSFYPD